MTCTDTGTPEAEEPELEEDYDDSWDDWVMVCSGTPTVYRSDKVGVHRRFALDWGSGYFHIFPRPELRELANLLDRIARTGRR